MPDSWQLKLDRAEQHLKELRRNLVGYLSSNPYEIVRIEGRVGCQQKHPGYACGGRWAVRITEQPDPYIAILTGDVLHNIRSALDHIAVSLVPSRRRSKASFPIETERIWAKQERRYIVRDPIGRRRWRTAITGMSAEAVAVIEALQPYHATYPSEEALAVLSRLENADKHRQLSVLTVGLTDITIWGTARGRTKELTIERPGHFVTEDGTELAHFAGRGGAELDYAEVQVEIRGTPLVATKIADPDSRTRKLGEYWPLGQFFDTVIASIRSAIFAELEPCVRRR